MAKSPRELSAELAVIVCQLSELTNLARRLPPVSSTSLHEERLEDKPGAVPLVWCYIHDGPVDKADPDAPEHLRQINALRQWARALGSDLTLEDARPYIGETVCRCLSATGELPSGLRVRAYTLLSYDPDAPEYHGRRIEQPAPDAAVAA